MTKKSQSTGTFIAACQALPHPYTPVWFMRQAGRSLPEYRSIRGTESILSVLRNPDLSAEITLQPVQRYGTDAAILYSDIVVPIHAIGFGMDVKPGIGPVAEQPFRRTKDLERLRPLDPETDTPYVIETIRNLSNCLSIPLIGFAGAPFTMASYLIEGKPSRTYARTKALMLGDPNLWFGLLDRLADLAIASLRSQIEAGVQAVQIFDSWAGALSPSVYEQYVLPASKKVFTEIADLDVPRIHFGVGNGEILQLMANAGSDVMGIDWRIPLDEARRRLGQNSILQGNLDPAVCLAPIEVVDIAVNDILNINAGHPGHIFNLGHGVLPETDPGVLKHIVEVVHAYEIQS